MAVPLVPPGADSNDKAVLKSLYDAVRELQQPRAPIRLPSLALKADLPAAADFKECAVICDEINSVCVSTEVAGNYAWRRADGGAI